MNKCEALIERFILLEGKEEKAVYALASKLGGEIAYDNTDSSEEDDEMPEAIVELKKGTDINAVAKKVKMKIEKLPYNKAGIFLADGKTQAKNMVKGYDKNKQYILVSYNV